MIKSVPKKLKGFTLIELLVVIAILGILAAAVLVAINPGKRTRQAQDSKRKNDIGALATEIQGYYTTPGAGCYPTSLQVLVTNSYLKQMPLDPTTNAQYTYNFTNAGTCATDGNADTGGTEAYVFATLAEPVTAGSVWCYQTTTGKAQEVANAAACNQLDIKKEYKFVCALFCG